MKFSSRWTAGACLALSLLVFGGRAMLIQKAGSHLPLWDHWFGEFWAMLLPLSNGTLDLETLARTHNEHHLFFLRLLSLALIKISGHWEPRDELVVSAIVRTLGLLVLFLLLGRGQVPKVRVMLLVLLALVGGLPIGTFNLLSSFQMTFFIDEALAVAVMALLCGGALTSERVACAMALLLVMLLNFTTVMIAVLSVMVVLCLKTALSQTPKKSAFSLILLLGTFLAFVAVTTPRMPRHAATSFGQFITVLSQLAAWPFPDLSLLALLPFVPPVLLFRRMMRDGGGRPESWLLLAVSLHSLLQKAAIAFARAGGSVGSFPQYNDTLWFGHVVGLVALTEALRPGNEAPSWWRSRMAGYWAFWLGASLVADVSLRGLPMVQAVQRAVEVREPAFSWALQQRDFGWVERETEYVSRMVQVGDYRFFDHPSLRFAVPDPFLKMLENDRDRFMPLLPARLSGAPPSWLSKGMSTLISLGPYSVILGLVVLGWCFIKLRGAAEE